MAKNNRGKGLKKVPAHGRATCPACKRTGIKVIFETKIDEKTIKLCKDCKKTNPEKLVLS